MRCGASTVAFAYGLDSSSLEHAARLPVSSYLFALALALGGLASSTRERESQARIKQRKEKKNTPGCRVKVSSIFLTPEPYFLASHAVSGGVKEMST